MKMFRVAEVKNIAMLVGAPNVRFFNLDRPLMSDRDVAEGSI
jgi:hypothetical protein